MEGLGVLQQVLQQIGEAMGQGRTALEPVLLGYVGFFGMAALVWLLYGIVSNGRAIPHAANLLFKMAVVGWCIQQWPWLLENLQTLAIHLGLGVSGSEQLLPQFLDPGAWIRLSLRSGKVLWDAFLANIGLTTPVQAFVYFCSWLAYVLAFAVCAFRIFWVQLELIIASLGGLCLLPTLVFRFTAFIAQGVLAYAANMFARFLLTALLAGAMWRHLEHLAALATKMDFSSMRAVDLSMQAAFVAAVTAWALAFCFLNLNKLASMLTSGLPQLSGAGSFSAMASTLLGAGSAMLTGGASAAAGALGAARGTLGVGGGLIGGAQQLGSAVRTAMGSASLAPNLGQAARQLYAGVQQGASAGYQSRLAQLMGQGATAATTTASHHGRQTLQQLMTVGRTARQDQAHRGIHR
jgi:type IV secretory pathway TrbL component